MFSRPIVTVSEAETMMLGKQLAGELKCGDLVAFFGNLGSGKTIMIKGICEGLGVSQSVHSPTFVIINQYEGVCKEKPIIVHHFDFYRIERLQEQDELGLDELFWNPDSIGLIEWAERIQTRLINPYWRIDLERIDELQRKITVQYQT